MKLLVVQSGVFAEPLIAAPSSDNTCAVERSEHVS